MSIAGALVALFRLDLLRKIKYLQQVYVVAVSDMLYAQLGVLQDKTGYFVS